VRTINNKEIALFRVMNLDEYNALKDNNGMFTEYDYAMEVKWFATSMDHVMEWKDKFKYKDGEYKIIEINILQSVLNDMHYVELLDGIGPAYSAEIHMLNVIERRIHYHE